MARPKRFRRTPFVITVTAVAAANPLACGGRAMTSSDDPAQGGTAGSGTGGTSASGGSSGGGTGGVGGVGAGGNPPGFGGTGAFGGVGGTGVGGTGGVISACPPSRPLGWQAGGCALLHASDTCSYTERCQSGEVTFTYGCTDGYFRLVTSGCAVPYDSCPGTGLWCSPGGNWFDSSAGTNPPAPCPDVRPVDGTSCYIGGFGAHQTPCAYLCGSGNWTLSSCVPMDAGTGTWQSDGVCETGE
jgi:hypothetical protein